MRFSGSSEMHAAVVLLHIEHTPESAGSVQEAYVCTIIDSNSNVQVFV